MERTEEIIVPTLNFHMSNAVITLDEDTARVVYALAWEKMEAAREQFNAAFDSTEWSSDHEKVKELLWAATDLKQAADVVYEMTALPDDEVQ